MYHRDGLFYFIERLIFGSMMTSEMEHIWFLMSYCSERCDFLGLFLVQSTLVIVGIPSLT